jgi:hypothetical protein
MPTKPTEAPIADLVERIAHVSGIAAVVLGGSRAVGTATADSDYDIGLYIEPGAPFEVAALNAVVAPLDDRRPAEAVTARGAWGPWIDGGGWLTVQGWRVDLLYRDLGKVREVIGEARAGRFTRHYQPGHPHGFFSTIYMGEVALCRPLVDPSGIIAQLKSLTDPYPAALRENLAAFFLWEATFSLENGRKSLGRRDIAYGIGCAFRSVACLTQVLFAVNGIYGINEKGAVFRAAALPLAPDALAETVDDIFARIAGGEISAGFDILERLIGEARALLDASRAVV